MTRQRHNITLSGIKVLILFILSLGTLPQAIAKADITCAEEVCIEVENLTGDVLLFFSRNKLSGIPVSVNFDIDKTNLRISEDEVSYVVPGDGKRHYLFSLYENEPGGGWKYNYRFNWNKGDFRARHDNSYRYRLPFAKGKKYKINQSCFGDFSHQDENTLDFGLPSGSAVHAAREGIVAGVKEDSSINGSSLKYAKHGNYVVIRHSDNTFASYYHLKHLGAAVAAGDYVQAGQLVGYSGNTGFSDGPHLHFEVFKGKRRGKDNETFPVTFRTSKGAVVCPAKGEWLSH